jgi:signal transduction histidine kinase
MTIPFISIRTKLIRLTTRALLAATGLFLLLSTALAVINAQYSFAQTRTVIHENLISKGRTLAGNNSLALRSMAADNAFVAIRELVSSTLRNDPDVVYGIYMDGEHRPWVWASRSDASGSAQSGDDLTDSLSLWAGSTREVSFRETATDSIRLLEFAAPVEAEGERLGTIRYGISTAPMNRAISEAVWGSLRRIGLHVIIFVIFMGGIFEWQVWAMRREADTITHPVMELATVANAITAGNYNLAVSTSTNDEVGTLARSLEAMRTTVKGYTEDLEGKVAERTERLNQTMDELKRSNTELEQFAYVASHDLQEPLRMVASYLQLVSRRYGDRIDKDGHEFIAFAVDGSVRMQQLIDDLLSYSRVGTKGKAFVPTACEGVYAKATRNLQIAIEDRNASVTHDALPTLPADEGQLVQLLQNLVGNALKFCKDRPPRVHVSAVKKGVEWEFTIRDNGIGIPKEQFDRVFQIFQRLHPREEYEGTGIGLAVCKKIVERHGGRIWPESEVGVGTTFHFTIPEVSVQTQKGVSS